MSVYEFWHVASGNLLGSLPALMLVRDLVISNGAAIADELELGVEDDNGDFTHLGTGPQLVARTEAVLTAV
jgi:hypothetical protein